MYVGQASIVTSFSRQASNVRIADKKFAISFQLLLISQRVAFSGRAHAIYKLFEFLSVWVLAVAIACYGIVSEMASLGSVRVSLP